MEKQVTITLEQAIELYKTNESLRPMLLNSFTLDVLENKEIKCWEDLGEISGYYIDNCSKIDYAEQGLKNEYKNLFATKSQAESSLAKSQLSQLLKEFNGNWKPDFSINQDKYKIDKCIICKQINTIKIVVHPFINSFLAFETIPKAELFLSRHNELIEQYFGDI